MNNEEFDKIIRDKTPFNGKPFVYWQAHADELVIELLIRAAQNADERSLIGYLARSRLYEMAKQESLDLTEKVLAQRNTCIAGFQRILAEILSATNDT